MPYKTTLITGLDGSGKSTILSKISHYAEKNNFEIILLPHIDADSIKGDLPLRQAAVFVNNLSREADVKKLPQLKAIALFAAMLLCKNIIRNMIGNSDKRLYFERHPLIDTGIYAQFYAEKLAPNSIDPEQLSDLDRQYAGELEYILRLLPEEEQIATKGKSRQLFEFIYRYFHLEKNTKIRNMADLFQMELPEKIYYLKASPQVLYDRIKKRKILEAHETVAVFEKLGAVYDYLFHNINQKYPGKVTFIDANDIRELEKLHHLEQ